MVTYTGARETGTLRILGIKIYATADAVYQLSYRHTVKM
jgi:hypothetical protein